MHRLIVFLPTTVVIASACLWIRSFARAEDPAEAQAEPGFRLVFNGKDLAGWHKNPQKIGHGTGGHWYVEDGALAGEQDPPGSGNGGILLTDEKFGDFEVIFETKPDWGVCSGFFLRSNDKGQCYQVMVDYHDAGNVGEIYREGLDGHTNRTFQIDGIYEETTGKVLKAIKATRVEKNDRGAGGEPNFDLAQWPKIWKLQDWNTIRARVEGNPPTITTWLNGTFVSRYTSDKKFEEALGDRGSIALQVHGGSGWPKGAKVLFRKIRVKDLH